MIPFLQVITLTLWDKLAIVAAALLIVTIGYMAGKLSEMCRYDDWQTENERELPWTVWGRKR